VPGYTCGDVAYWTCYVGRLIVFKETFLIEPNAGSESVGAVE